MNKKLWKSIVKSFSKNKISIILLTIIIFISSSTFTLLENTAHSFQSSYNNVIDKGNLHDFTIKEKYSNSGELKFEPSQKIEGTDKTIYIPDTNSKFYGKNTKDKEFIYLLKENSFLNITKENTKTKEKKELESLPIRISKENLIKNQINLEIGIPENKKLLNTKYQNVFEELNNIFLKTKEQKTIDNFKREKFNQIKEENIIQNKNWLNINSKNFNNLKSPKIFWNKKHDEKITIKYNFNKWLNYSSFSTDINNYFKNTYKKTKVFDAKICPNKSKSTKDVQKFLKNNEKIWKKWTTVSNVENKTIDEDEKVKKFKDTFEEKIFNQIKLLNSKKFQQKIMEKYSNILEKAKNVESLSIIGNNNKNFKIVNNGALDSIVNKTVIFNGNDVEKPYSEEEMDKGAEKIKKQFEEEQTSFININKTKNWKYVVQGFQAGMIPKTKCFIDSTAFQGVVSPSYAKENNIKPINPNVLNSKEYIDMINDLSGEKRKKFADKYSNNIIFVDYSMFVVTGIGTTPDFAYPVIDHSHPIPSVKNQAIIFVNGNGYNRMLDAFRTNPQENFLAYKFKNSFKGNKNEILNKIENLAKKNMSWPSNVQIVSKNNDINENIILAPYRISFLQQLIKTIKTVAFLLVASITLLSALMISIIIKKNITSQKKTLAILNANGYSKKEIAFSYIFIGIIIVGISTILGYLFGYSCQFIFINIFKNYWTLPILQQSFSWVSLIFTVCIPIILVSILIYVIALITLKGSVVNNLLNKNSKFSDAISTKAISKLKFFGIKTQLSASFLFSNLSKMFLILVATLGTITATSISMTTLGKFDKALQCTENVNKYKYAIDLITPTKEGGQYIPVIYQDPNSYDLKNKYSGKPTRHWAGMEYGDEKGKILPSQLGKKWNTFIHYPSMIDGRGGRDGMMGWKQAISDPKNNKKQIINEATLFLKNRIQFKPLLDLNYGGQDAINPWSIARSLMPSNQNSKAIEDYWDYFNKLEKFINKKPKYNDKKYKPFKDAIENYLQTKTNTKIKKILDFSSIKDTTTNSLEIMSDAWKENILPYQIAYDQITTNVNDETYTHIDGNILLKNIKGDKNFKQISIKGINKDTKYINSNQLNALNDDKYKNWKENEDVPILINKFVEEYYGLSVGSSFSMNALNTYNRYEKKINKIDSKKMNYKVVGIIDSYSQMEILTKKEIANQILGLKETEGFNGIFSNENTPNVLNNVNLYSVSGIYPEWDTLKNNKEEESNELVSHYLNLNKNDFEKGSTFDKIANSKLPTKKFEEVFSNSPYFSTIENVDWQPISMITLKSISDLSSNLIWITESLAIIMSLIFIVIIGTMMIDDNKKNISTLKVLGYRNKEIRNAFIKSFIPSLILGIILSIPIIFSILILIKIAIMSFGSVLIPLNMSGWEIIASSIIVIGLFLTIFVSSIYKLKSQSAIEAFKE